MDFPRKLHTNFHTYLVSFVSHLGSKGKQMHCVSNTNGPLLIHEHFKRSVYVQFCFEIIMSLHLFHMYRLNFISFLDYFSRFNALNEIDCLPFSPIQKRKKEWKKCNANRTEPNWTLLCDRYTELGYKQQKKTMKRLLYALSIQCERIHGWSFDLYRNWLHCLTMTVSQRTSWHFKVCETTI